MEFACSHVVCNWRPESLTEGEVNYATQGFSSTLPCGLSRTHSEHPYDNRIAVIPRPISSLTPPPVPPRSSSPRDSQPNSLPPPLPPRGLEAKGQTRLKANVNVVSLKIGNLVDISKASSIQSTQKPVHCGKCKAVMSSVSNSTPNATTWCCEFCGTQNVLSQSELRLGRSPLRTPPGRDMLYVDEEIDGDYMNLDDMLVIFCVDISGSMSVTSEVSPGNSMRSPTYVSRLQGVQEALQMALSSVLKTSPHRRVALVTFNDEVTVYGDGTGIPLSLRDWALVDYDHIKECGEKYSTPHCIAETFQCLTQRVKELREHGATALGPAALISVAMASQFTGSKVIICTDGRANIGLGQIEQEFAHSPAPSPYFYNQLAHYAADKGVIVSVMTFEGEDCRLAEVGKLADYTGGRGNITTEELMSKVLSPSTALGALPMSAVHCSFKDGSNIEINIINISTIGTEIQTALADSVLATNVIATLLAPDGVYFPFEEDHHRLVREIGNVTDGVEITFQFAVKPDRVESFQRRDRVPFQLQLSFKTRDLKNVTRVITHQKRVTTSSWVWAGSLNMSVLGVHCAQLCARLTMEGRIHEAQSQLKAQQDLLKDISEQKPSPKEESIYGNWISTMSMICDDLTHDTQQISRENSTLSASRVPATGLSDEAAKVVYQMKRAKSIGQRSPKAAMLES